MRLRRFRKSVVHRAAPGVVFAYVFFLLFPHVAAVTHTHAGGAHPHAHALLSAHDMGLERAALSEAPGGTPGGELDREEPPRVVSSPKGAPALDVPRGDAHTHVQGDPNLAGIGPPSLASQPPAPRPAAPAFAGVFAPEEAAIAASARAPPRG